jgi:hypothetical protein
MNRTKRLDADAIKLLCFYEKLENRQPILKPFISMAETYGLQNVEASIGRLVEEGIFRREICAEDIPIDCLRVGDNYDSAVNEYCTIAGDPKES